MRHLREQTFSVEFRTLTQEGDKKVTCRSCTTTKSPTLTDNQPKTLGVSDGCISYAFFQDTSKCSLFKWREIVLHKAHHPGLHVMEMLAHLKIIKLVYKRYQNIKQYKSKFVMEDASIRLSFNIHV